MNRNHIKIKIKLSNKISYNKKLKKVFQIFNHKKNHKISIFIIYLLFNKNYSENN